MISIFVRMVCFLVDKSLTVDETATRARFTTHVLADDMAAFDYDAMVEHSVMTFLITTRTVG